jgi:hypothetical protein
LSAQCERTATNSSFHLTLLGVNNSLRACRRAHHGDASFGSLSTHVDLDAPSGHLDQRGCTPRDALERAGCTDAELLGHLRGPGPHVRGCWAVDLVLGKS